MIPKIIHQTWRTRSLPEPFAGWSQQWRQYHPHWEYRFYDDDDIERIVKERAPQHSATFARLARPIQRIDMFRYLIVWLDGGLYADLDMIPFKANDAVIAGQRCVLSVEHYFRPVRQRELSMRRMGAGQQITNTRYAASINLDINNSPGGQLLANSHHIAIYDEMTKKALRLMTNPKLSALLDA